MKLSNLVSFACLTALAATASCSQEGLDNVNTSGKGSGATSGTGMTSMGGSSGATATMGGSAGMATMGGSSGAATMGGSSGAATMGGSSGAATMGGSSGAATMGGSSGAATMGGSSGAGTMGGSSGAETMGGSAGISAGGMPAGGMAGTGMAGMGMAGSGGLTPEDIVPGLNGFYWEGTCSGDPSVTQATGHNCPMTGTLTSAPANGVNSEKTLMVKGTSGMVYTINIEVRGVIGTRCYTGGTRASNAGLSEDGNNNWWYVGGSYANPTGWWNTYELHVSPSTGDASGDVYYFNGSGVQGGNDCEREATYLVKYNASFKAKGGGTLSFKIHDQNGKGQQNCGKETDPNAPCTPRTVDLTGMAATPPNFKQPPTNPLEKTYYPQWMVIAVTSITSP
ncbi:MAG TPA: hypothetical protein VFV94_04235 [Polyangiaceae bacterium]|nr:hypothetical protein [Polyangiaceae bacterium]